MDTLQSDGGAGSCGSEKCGEFRIEREVGRGAYGVVYLAVNPDGRRVAVKVCRRAAADPERYARELRGAKLYMSVSASKGLVQMHDVVETSWGFYSVMDLADDEFDRAEPPLESYRPKTLAKVMEGEKALPLKECVKLGIALADGLATLQRHHLLHRDIKPGNVIYVGGKPVLSDPGLLIEESEAASLVGTPGYVPPEKFVGAEGDVYSLGITLKAASFGRSIEDLDKGPAQEADAGAAFFPAWWRILNKATDPVPSRRYQSAKALLKDLKALQLRMVMEPSSRIGRILKLAIGAMLLFVVFYVALSIHERMRVIDVMRPLSPDPIKVQMEQLRKDLSTTRVNNAKVDREKRDYFWDTYNHTPYSHNTKSIVNETLRKVEKVKRFSDSIKRDIAEIKAVDEARAAELQSCFDRIIELGAKKASLYQEINTLHEKAKDKTAKGLDDAEEFFHAQKLAKEKELYEQSNVLGRMVDELSRKRRYFIYDVRHKWMNYFPGKSHYVNGYTLKREIDKIAAVDKTKAAELQALFERLTKLDAKKKALEDARIALRDKGKAKAKDGLDDMEEFRQARKIHEEECQLFDNEIKPLADELETKRKRYVEDFVEDT